MEEENMKMQVDLHKARDISIEKLDRTSSKSNEIWYSILRLIITLSSSFLVITLAIVEKLFPPVDDVLNLPILLLFSWFALFFAIIFGIVAELNEVIFLGKHASSLSNVINEYTNKIVQGKDIDIVEAPKKVPLMHYNSIIWGALSIDSFIIALLFMCIALLTKIFSTLICMVLFIMVIIFVVWINIFLISERKK